MDSFIPLTMSVSKGSTADTCCCNKATAANDIRTTGHIAQAGVGGTFHSSHRATQTTRNGNSNHSATQTSSHMSDLVSRFHPRSPTALEPAANNNDVNTTVMPGLWTKPVTIESLAVQLEVEKSKRREAEQMARELRAELIKSKMEASEAKEEL
ncbi:uncharacterized protein BKCO1_700093 [Diplodia corticola]|uniref:Uncharacterized protein n=1 Tax=Diplodia corticola TaxID=236234 RepID=A0A1J9SAA6_9PEZI|nr:uncharacterized protein BKCO1_700093 [Diplodia corticola]OJD37415.1 hypothetical protein BKCO1_700093 [Diplodia corticola]